MDIFYVMIEAVPNSNNPEIREFGGAYINCWVKAATEKDALDRVKEYVEEENWVLRKVESIFAAQRSAYLGEPDSLVCYEEACKNGISAIFYTWPIEENLFS